MGPVPEPPPISPAAAPATSAQSVRDREHLNLLAVFHFIGAGLAVLGLGFLCIHFLIFQAVMTHQRFGGGAHSEWNLPMAIFSVFYLFFGAWLVSCLVLNVLSGFFLLKRRHRVFSIVTAAFNCAHVPFGTLLGVFTIVVLSRDSVRREYATGAG
jgi:hypothetical protein